MSKSCTILAHVRNANGDIVESRLFKDLLHYTSGNRELSKEYYAVGTSEDFLSKVRESEEFQVDENGEITFSSLRSLAKIDLETDKLIQVLNKDLGEGEYSYDEAVRRIQEFNDRNIFADRTLATMFPTGSNKYYIAVVPETKRVTDTNGKERKEGNGNTERKKLHDVVRNEELERRIKNLLRQNGVSVRFLEGDRKEGRYSTENISKAEDGLYGLIEVNENGYTTEVLAEEAGHFAVAALGDNPLVQRLEKLLQDTEVQKEALGESEYSSAQLGKNPAREVAGRLVGKALQRKLDNNSTAKVLANRIANLAKRVFYRIVGNDVRWIAAKAEQRANQIAYQFVEGSNKFSIENAINIKETMHDKCLTVNQKVYRDTVDELGRMVKQLQAVAQDRFTGQMQASLAMTIAAATDGRSGETALQMVESAANTYAFDGIVQALVQVGDYLGADREIDRLMKAVNLDNPSDFYANMARNGRYLRQARTFLRSAEIIIDTIETALIQHNLGGTLVIPNGNSLNDVRYQDENGTWKSINMRAALTAYKNIAASMSSNLSALEGTYFARFCEDIYGSKYITTTVGKTWANIWHNQEALGEEATTIASMVTGEGMEDIDVFHRYLGSMANNPDVIGQIIDKVVKTANKTADDLTLRYRERLQELKERAEKLGLDTADLVERDENGVPTGNMITPPASPTKEGNTEEDAIYDTYMSELGYVPAIRYSEWEKQRDKHKKAHWEQFKADHPDWQSMPGFTRGLLWDQYYRKQLKDWNAKHSIKVTVKDSTTGDVKYVRWVPNAIYASDQWDLLKAKYPDRNGESLERWVYDYCKIKRELDEKLPVGATVSYRLPQFRGTFMNTVRNSKALQNGSLKTAKAWGKTFGRRVLLESFVETSDETDYGDMTTMNSSEEELLGTKLNYEEERAARIPVFGINKLQNMADLSTDLLHSMLAYASMATSYQCLDNVVDALEVGTEALYNRNLTGGNTWVDAGVRGVERGTKKIGNTFRKLSGRHETRATGAKNRAYGRYLKYLDKQVYGISATYWGIPIWKGKRILLNKVIQNISSLGGTLFLKGNVLGGTVNTLTGFNNIFKEAVTGDYFNTKDWIAAHKYYWSHFPEMWTADLGRLRKNNKLDLFLEQMNALSNNRENFRSWHTTRSRANNIYRMLGYLPYSSGDHYMQAMSYLAVAHGTQLYDVDGTLSSNLWDAYSKAHEVDIPNDDRKVSIKANALKFARFCPLNASDIISENLSKEGAFLKKAARTTSDFEDWLLYQDENFADETYREDHAYEYNDFRSQYDSLSDEELMHFKADKYRLLTGILQKVEDYVKSSSPLVAVPAFSAEEQQYLRTKRVGTGNYKDILQVVRDDIYSIIWTKADESAYMDKCRETNNRLHGIYNQQDKTAWHQQWYTNAFLAMKGWALGYLEMMYSNNHYSVALGKNVEGFVNTGAKVLASSIKGLFGCHNQLSFMDMIISMIAPWSKSSMKAMKEAGFSEEQNFNMRRLTASACLMGLLLAMRLATAPPDKEDKEEMDPMTGLVYYFAMRTLIEQEAFLYVPEAFVQSGSLLDFMPVGGSALFDMGKLMLWEAPGAMFGSEDDSDFFYQRNDKNGRYEKGDSKFMQHLERITPYWKSWWAIQHPYEAAENYEFGRKLRTR